MEILYLIALLGFISIIFFSLYPSKNKLKEKFFNFDENELKNINIFSKKIKVVSLISAFLVVPLTANFLILKVDDNEIRKFLFPFFLVLIFFSIILHCIYSKKSSVSMEVLKEQTKEKSREGDS